MTSRVKRWNPARRQVHVDQEPHSSARQMNLATLRETCGECESLSDIRLLKVRKVGQQIFDRAARGYRFHDHANGYAHSSNARFATHDFRIDRNAAKLLHVVMIAHPPAGAATQCPKSMEASRRPNLRLQKVYRDRSGAA